MIKKICAHFESIFGPQGWERAMSDSEDKRVKKLLKTIANIRFWVTPISMCIYVLVMVAELVALIFTYLKADLIFCFEMINDSVWINTEWFGIDPEEIDAELEKRALGENDSSPLINEKP